MGYEDEAEALAGRASQESGLDDRPNADPAIMAVAYCGLRLVPHASRAARLVEDRLYYPRAAPPQERAFLQAHELGHDIVRHARWKLAPALEELVASRIGCALLLPRNAFLRDVRATSADLEALTRLWPLASPWVIARRVCELVESSAAAQFSPSGKCRRRIGQQATATFAEAVEVAGVLISLNVPA